MELYKEALDARLKKWDAGRNRWRAGWVFDDPRLPFCRPHHI